jgi:hypothetical protein
LAALIAAGRSNREIATALVLGERTVEFHVANICSERLEENAGPIGTLFYGFSVLLCMTMSLAEGGAGLGTLGLPETALSELSTQAGFGSVRRVPLENPFNVLYELRP